jgi:anti-sigma factor RsiW
MKRRCDWCEEVLQPYLDRALTEAERLKAEKHLKDCEYCDTRYRFEEKLRQRVVLVMVEPMPPALKQRLSQLRLEL